MVRGLNSSTDGELEWMGEFAKDFRRRFLSLLSFKFREFGSVTALSVLEAANVGVKKLDGEKSRAVGSPELSILMSPFDLKRLESYANNMLDYHIVLDLLPTVASLYFEGRLGDGVKLSAVQASIMLGLGLQRKTIEEVEGELSLPVSHALALFVKVIRKITKHLVDIQKVSIGADIPLAPPTAISRVVDGGESTQWKPVETNVEDELNEAGDEATKALREKQREMIDSLDLSKYAINDANADWSVAEAQVSRLAKGEGATVISVKTTEPSAGKKRKSEGGDEKDKKTTRRGKKAKR